jgi:hypothetical protein
MYTYKMDGEVQHNAREGKDGKSEKRGEERERIQGNFASLVPWDYTMDNTYLSNLYISTGEKRPAIQGLVDSTRLAD